MAKGPSYPAAFNVQAPMIERVRPAQWRRAVRPDALSASIFASSRLLGRLCEPGMVNCRYSAVGRTSNSRASRWCCRYSDGVTSGRPHLWARTSPKALDQTYSPFTKPSPKPPGWLVGQFVTLAYPSCDRRCAAALLAASCQSSRCTGKSRSGTMRVIPAVSTDRGMFVLPNQCPSTWSRLSRVSIRAKGRPAS